MDDKYIVQNVGRAFCVMDAVTGEVMSGGYPSQIDAFMHFVVPSMAPVDKNAWNELKVDGCGGHNRSSYQCPKRPGEFGLVLEGYAGCRNCGFCQVFRKSGRKSKVYCTWPVVCRTPEEFPPVDDLSFVGPIDIRQDCEGGVYL